MGRHLAELYQDYCAIDPEVSAGVQKIRDLRPMCQSVRTAECLLNNITYKNPTTRNLVGRLSEFFSLQNADSPPKSYPSLLLIVCISSHIDTQRLTGPGGWGEGRRSRLWSIVGRPHSFAILFIFNPRFISGFVSSVKLPTNVILVNEGSRNKVSKR